MKKAVLACTMLVAGCSSQDEKAVGTWEAESCVGHTSCSFTIEKRTTAVGDLYLTLSKDSSGPLKHIEGEYYELLIDNTAAPLRFKDGKFYNASGLEFKRVKTAKIDE